MNKEIKAKWVAWLRDPAHKQTTGALHKDDGFCCLGGLCEVYRQERGGEWEKHGTFYLDDCAPLTKYRFLGGVGTLPMEVATWAGITDPSDRCDPSVPNPFGGCGGVKLSTLNDGYLPPLFSNRTENETVRLTFPQIADLIEKHL